MVVEELSQQREVEEVEVRFFQWEEVVEGAHDVELFDYGMEEVVEVGQGREEDLGPHEVEGVLIHHLGLGGYSEMEDLLHLCG